MQRSRITVLVVEDHAFQRSVITEVLATLGVERVLDAGDGPAALELLANQPQPVDVLICDLDLPGMNGAELIRLVATRRLARSLILCSAARQLAHEMVATLARGLGLRVLGHIGKPMSAHNLQGLIDLLEDAPAGPEPL